MICSLQIRVNRWAIFFLNLKTKRKKWWPKAFSFRLGNAKERRELRWTCRFFILIGLLDVEHYQRWTGVLFVFDLVNVKWTTKKSRFIHLRRRWPQNSERETGALGSIGNCVLSIQAAERKANDDQQVILASPPVEKFQQWTGALFRLVNAGLPTINGCSVHFRREERAAMNRCHPFYLGWWT